MKKFGVLLCVMLCVPMFAFKANNEEQIILTVQYERPDKGHGGLHRTSVRHLYLDQNDHILTIPNGTHSFKRWGFKLRFGTRLAGFLPLSLFAYQLLGVFTQTDFCVSCKW